MARVIGEINSERLQREHDYLEMLVRVGEALAKAVDYHETLQSVCTAIVEAVADICILTLKEGDRPFVAAAAHRNPDLAERLLESNEHLTSQRGGVVHHAIQAISTRQALLVPFIDRSYLQNRSASDEHEAFMRKMRYQSLIIVPLISETQGVLGAITLVLTDGHTDYYDGESLKLAQDVARRCATAIAKAKLYEQTRQLATLYQRSSLPSHLPRDGARRFDACYEPSSEYMLVGGDWYDAFELRDGRIAITVGDVLGHGMQAAVWMSRLSNGMRAAFLTSADPSNALRVADEILRLEQREEFTTAIAAIYDPFKQTLTVASAGHPGPLIWNGSEVLDPLQGRSLPLGLLEGADTPLQVTKLERGSFVVFFTDGLLEWNRNIFDAWSHLTEAVADPRIRQADHPAHAIRNAIVKSEEHSDDIAVLTLSIP